MPVFVRSCTRPGVASLSCNSAAKRGSTSGTLLCRHPSNYYVSVRQNTRRRRGASTVPHVHPTCRNTTIADRPPGLGEPLHQAMQCNALRLQTTLSETPCSRNHGPHAPDRDGDGGTSTFQTGCSGPTPPPRWRASRPAVSAFAAFSPIADGKWFAGRTLSFCLRRRR